MNDPLLIVTRSEGVETITLNRPDRLNALLLPASCEALRDAIARAAGDDDVRCVVLTGAGRAFCAGADLTQPLEEWSRGDAAATQQLVDVLVGLHTMPKPVVAAVNGVAVGAGCGLALACDIVIASERASFIHAFVNIGLHPDFGAAWSLPRIVGPARARELIFTGRTVEAEEALRIGMIARIAPHDRFEEEVAALARGLAAAAPLALRLAKETLRESTSMDFGATIELEVQRQRECVGSADFRERVAAFREKRAPVRAGEG